jgi:hypothetical protein
MAFPATAMYLQDAEVHCLRDLFARWQLPEQYHALMAPEWRATLAQPCATDADVRAAVMAAAPALVPEACGAAACAAVGGDALAFVQASFRHRRLFASYCSSCDRASKSR